MGVDLTEFIESNPDARELKRATAVKMYQQGYKHREITEILGVVSGFISKWTRIYEHRGVQGLLLAHKGSSGYLNQSQRQEIIIWLKNKSYWHLSELQEYVEDRYDVVFASKQSYYQWLLLTIHLGLL